MQTKEGNNEIVINERFEIGGGWEVYETSRSVYHRMNDEITNIKLVNNKDNREIVVKLDDKTNTYKIVDDNLNVGTYNYFNPDGIIGNVAHIFADVIPYYFYGNTPSDEPRWSELYNVIVMRKNTIKKLDKEEIRKIISKGNPND